MKYILFYILSVSATRPHCPLMERPLHFLYYCPLLLHERTQALFLFPSTPDRSWWQKGWFQSAAPKGWSHEAESNLLFVCVLSSLFYLFICTAFLLGCKHQVDIFNECRPDASSTLHTNAIHREDIYYITPNAVKSELQPAMGKDIINRILACTLHFF